MPGPTSKKPKTQPDFKRLKAKVGKRAIKPANVTDTKFQVATINVGKQNVAVNQSASAASQELQSSRGKSIIELTVQLRHPAVAVRVSAAKGLEDAVTRQQTTPEVVRANLADLIPACAKCSVDENSEVRQLAFAVLTEIVGKATTFESDKETNRTSDAALRPFVPLLMAHVASMLNSLDRKTQLDGSRFIELLSTALPTLVSPYATTILPAFVRLLSYLTSEASSSKIAESAKSSQGKKRKRKRKDNSSKDGLTGSRLILQSFVSLLKTKDAVRGSMSQRRIIVDAEPDLVFTPGGRSCNALIITGLRYKISHVTPIENLKALPSLKDIDKGTISRIEKGNQGSKELSVQIVQDLLSKLRDAYAEAMQNGTRDNKNGFVLSPSFLDELLLLVKAAHLLLITCSQTSVEKNRNVIRQKWSQILALLLETFPVIQDGPRSNIAEQKVEFINAEICATLIKSYSLSMIDGKEEKKRMEQVLNYLFSILEDDNCKVDASSDTALASSSVELGDAVFDVLQAVVSLSRNSDIRLSDSIPVSILKRLSSIYFSTMKLDDDIKAIARSSLGRRCALLVQDTVAMQNYELSLLDSPYKKVCRPILQALMVYLCAWSGDFINESYSIINLLHNVIRRLNVRALDINENNDESILVEFLRSNIHNLVKCKRKSKSKNGPNASIFEYYPEWLQRHVLGLIVMLESPTEGVLNGLSDICARYHTAVDTPRVTPELVEFISQSIHTIRKTISMQAYLGFVTNSCGLTQSLSSMLSASSLENVDLAKGRQDGMVKVDNDIIRRLDFGVRIMCRSLVLCGSIKVLSMLQPLISAWLRSDIVPKAEFMVRARAAVSILALFSLDLNSGLDDPTASVFATIPDVEKNAANAIDQLFSLLTLSDEIDEDNAVLVRPMFALLQTEPKILKLICANIHSDVGKMDQERLEKSLRFMLLVVSDSKLPKFLSQDSDDFLSQVQFIESTASEGPLESLAVRLRTLAELNLK